MTLPDRLRLTPLEAASGYVFGEDSGADRLPSSAGPPRDELERTLRAALASPPCVITFSGGRDSSALLALAVDVARREGLPLPIAATSRFPEAPGTDEASWQERVIAHVGLEDWVRLEHSDELDVVGPIATAILRRHGLLWPANSHLLAPHARAASGGTIVTGTGGDQLFEPSRLAHHSALLTRTGRPGVRDLRRGLFVAAPQPFRRLLVRHRFRDPTPCPWLRPEAQRRVTAGARAEIAREPVRPGARIRWAWRMRPLQIALASLDVIAADAGTRMIHPLLEPRFLAALARHRLPPFSRADATRSVFGDVLPYDVFDRRTKPMFEQPLWNRYSEEFARRAPIEAVDERWVDPARLTAFWADPRGASRFRSATILQQLWLEDDCRRWPSGSG